MIKTASAIYTLIHWSFKKALVALLGFVNPLYANQPKAEKTKTNVNIPPKVVR